MKGRGDSYTTGKRVSLWKNGKVKDWLVARLVAMTWCDGYSNGMTVDHINGDRLDNRASNLEWVPLSVNIQRGFASGLYKRIQNPISLLDSYGNTYTFRSMAEGSRYLGRSHSYLHNAIKHGLQISDINGVQYTPKSFKEERVWH